MGCKKLLTEIELIGEMTNNGNVVISRLYPFKYKAGDTQCKHVLAKYEDGSYIFGEGVSIVGVRALLKCELIREIRYSAEFMVYELVSNPVYTRSSKVERPTIKVDSRSLWVDELKKLAAEYYCTIEYNASIKAFKLTPMNGEPFESPYIPDAYKITDLDAYQWDCVISRIVDKHRGR